MFNKRYKKKTGIKGKLYSYKGGMFTMYQLSQLPDCNVSEQSLRNYIKRGDSIEQAMLARSKYRDELTEDIPDYIIAEILPDDEKVNSDVNHCLIPPTPHTTSHYWWMRSVAERRTDNTINLKGFI